METDSPSLQPKCPQSHSVTSPISPSCKGKAPMEEPAAPADNSEDDSRSLARSCGICLSEEGRTVRGCIDCCDHYFCFLCIIEWSKIESRCPLCKGRFAKIRRMRTDGSFIGDRDVTVPVRNQIYDPQRNTTSWPLDPYANINCTICAGSTDENLLLLCDLCDTAVHTYCAGLGAIIPEGDWFCQECAQMKAEELNSSSPSPHPITEKPSFQASSSIFDIVREPGEPDPEANELLTTLLSPQQQQPQSSVSGLPQQARQNVGGACGQGSRVHMMSETKVRESSVRTLHRCRDAHKYIQDLRENWDAIRSGSLSFSSRNFASKATNNTRVNDASRSHGSNGSLRGDTLNNCLHDVDRAWKMFDIAKTKQLQKSSGASSASRNISVRVSFSKDSKNMSLGTSFKSVPSKTKSNMFTGLEMRQSFKRHEGCGSKRAGQHSNGITLGREKTAINHTNLAAASPGKCITSSHRNTQKLIKNDAFRGRVATSSLEKLSQGSLRVHHEQGFSSCTKSQAGLLSGGSDLSYSNLHKKPTSLNVEGCSGQIIDSDAKHVSESNQLQRPTEKRRNAENTGSVSKRFKVDNEAKSEIQSLVKLNLKVLSAGKKLEVDVFKDIARRSTHEILAACGLEPPKHNKIPIPKPICSHDDKSKKHGKSSLMPSSCKECFYAFVKDLVGSIMSDKISC